MKILGLRLKGFIGVKKGLGLDEINLDFSGLSGLIAFAGMNGSSKTTVLDCMHGYRMLASRKGALRHHVFLRDSEKEFSFEFHGDHYRTLIKIDAESERSEGFIWKNGESLVDGKVTKYDQAIIKLCGSATLFFNSVFCGQGSTRLNDMTTGDLKKLFSEFLRLDKLIEYENTSKQCANMLSAQVEKLEREINILKDDVDNYEASITKLKNIQIDKEKNDQGLAKLTKDLKQAETKLADIQKDIQKNVIIRIQIKGLQDGLDRIDKEISTDQEQSTVENNESFLKINAIDIVLSSLEQASISLQDAKNHKQDHEERLFDLTSDLKLAEINLSDINTNIQKNEVIETQVKGLKDTLDRFEKEIESDQGQSKVEIDNLNAKSQAVALEIVEIEDFLSNEPEIRKAAKNTDTLKSSLEYDLKNLGVAITDLFSFTKAVSEKEKEGADRALAHGKLFAAMENTRDQLFAKIESAKLSATDLDKRDPECKSSTCSFIVSALKTQGDIPKLEEELAVEASTIADMEKAYSDTMNEFNTKIETLRRSEETGKSEKAQLEAKITKTEGELERIKSLAAELPRVETALSRKKDLEGRKSDLINEKNELSEVWEKRITEKNHQKQMAKDSIEKAEANIDADAENDLIIMNDAIDTVKKSIADITDKIKDLSQIIISTNIDISKKEDLEKRKKELTDEEIKFRLTWEHRISDKNAQKKQTKTDIQDAKDRINQDADDNLTSINNEIFLVKEFIVGRTAKITSLSASILSLEKEISQKEQARKGFDLKTAGRDKAIAESTEWTYLKNACGKDGLRALEIDSVAPVITGYANDLLLSTFGPSYTVKFRTQDEETGREIFDILVIREDGSEVLLDNLSGGQKVWGLKALRLAMTLIANEKSGKSFLTALSDEEDGPLDIENAQNFIKLYRAFMISGEFNDCFFISHKFECVAMADRVVEFGKGGITIN